MLGSAEFAVHVKERTQPNCAKAHIESYTHQGQDEAFLSSLHLEFFEGEITCLVGASGRGKTSLLRILLGNTDGKLEGSVSYWLDAQQFSPADVRRRGYLGLFSEDAGLVPWLTIGENLNMPSVLNPGLRRPSPEQVNSLLTRAALSTSILHQVPDQLSFGMQQRVRLVRTLLYDPRILLLDETFTGLDPITAWDIAALVSAFVSDSKCCCLLVTHDLLITSRIASRIVMLTRSSNLITIQTPISDQALLQFLRDHS